MTEKTNGKTPLVFWVLSLFFITAGTASLLLSFAHTTSSASPPSVLTYQGKILEGTDSVTTTKQMAFLLYDSLTGGTLLYTASGTLVSTSTINVTPSQGIFSVDIGGSGTNSLDPSIFADNSSVYLEVIVEGSTLSPRKRFTAAPFALNATTLDGVFSATASTSEYIPVSDSGGNFTFTGTPTSTAVSGGVIYINPSSATSDYTLFGIAVGGTQKFRIDEDGDTSVAGGIFGSSTLEIDATSTFNATSTFEGFVNLKGRAVNPVRVASHTAFSTTTERLQVQGDYLYTLDNTSGKISIFDISDPTSPTVLGSVIASPLITLDFYVQGDYLYTAETTNGVGVFDISDPSNIVDVSNYTSGITDVEDIEVHGNYAYVSDDGTGLTILDVTNPTSLVRVNTPSATSTDIIAVSGGYAYMACGSGNDVCIIDISDPVNPSTVSVYDTSAVDDIEIVGNIMYLARSILAEEIVDISDPTNPQQLHSSSFLGGRPEQRVEVAGNYAYYEEISNGLSIADISDPTSPNLVAVYTASSPGVGDVAISGNYAYVATGSGFEVVSIAGATISNAEIGSARIDNLQVLSETLFNQSVNIRGGLMVGNSGLLLSGDLGISAPTTSLTATNTISFSHTAQFLSYASSSDDIAFLFDTENTVTGTLFAIRNNGTEYFTVLANGNVGIGSSSPYYKLSVAGSAYISGDTNIADTITVVAGSSNVGINSTTPQYDLAVEGESYFVGTTTISNGPLDVIGRVVDPEEKATISTSNLAAAYAIDVVGDYAYVGAIGNDTFNIYDVSDPSDPTLISTIANGATSTLDSPRALKVVGNYAYVVAGDSNAFVVFDISDPANPFQVGKLVQGIGATELIDANGLDIQGNYAYVVSLLDNSLTIIDISNPQNPFQVSTIVDDADGGSATELLGAADIQVRGRYAYIASVYSSSFSIIDISDPTNPYEVAEMDDGDEADKLAFAYGVHVAGNYAYVVSATEHALTIINIADPNNPSVESTITNLSASIEGAVKVHVSGKYAYVAASTSGAVSIIDISDPSDPVEVQTITHGVNATKMAGASDVIVRGNYLYATAQTSGSFSIFDISGATISNAEIGSANVDNLQVLSQALFSKSVNIRGGLMVGNSGLLLSGNFGMSAPTTSIAATNTISFSHTALFHSQVTTTDDTAFLFDTSNYFPGTLLSIRQNGTEYLTLTGTGYFGLSTSSPNYTLSVSGTAYITGTTTIGSTLTVNKGDTAVGINSTTPQYDFAVSGTSYFSGTTTIAAGPAQINGRIINPVELDILEDGVGANLLDGGYHIEVVGDYAYVASATDDSLTIIDISDPGDLTQVGSITSAVLNGAAHVAVRGPFAYVVADGGVTGYITVVDVSDPANPQIVSTLQDGLDDNPIYIDVVGNYAYAVIGGAVTDEVVIIDITNPHSLQVVGSFKDGVDATKLDDPRRIRVVGKYAYVTSQTDDSLTVIDVSDPYNPIEMDTLVNAGGATELNFPNDIEIVGNYAYVASSLDSSLTVIDISNPANISEVSTLIDGSGATKMAGAAELEIIGNYAFVSGPSDNGISIIDISSSTNMVEVGTMSHGAEMTDFQFGGGMKIVGTHLYTMTNSGDTFASFDITGASITSARIGSAEIDSVQVMGDALFDQGVHIRGGLSVGHTGLLINGDLGIGAPTSSDATNVTNTIRFSHTALFESSATSADNYVFIFDTYNQFTTVTGTDYLLSVRNNGTPAFSVAGNGDVHASGTLYAQSATVGTPGNPGDLAERVDVAIDDSVEPGDVMVVDPNSLDTYRKSTGAYEHSVAGVISTNPTIVVGNGRTDNTAVMAMIGRVPVKVSTENGSIHAGDILVSASIPGHAMRYDASQNIDLDSVSIIGVALENFFDDVATGKAMALVRSGWINNRNLTLSQIQESIMSVATAQAHQMHIDPSSLTISQQNNQISAPPLSGNLNLNSYSIINVGSIIGANNAWQIDQLGRFVTNVTANGKTKSLYALQSLKTEYIISGSSALEQGTVRVSFDSTDVALIDPEQEMKVTITLTENAKGVFVTEKDETGFTVTEINGGESDATFDWVVIAQRRIDHIPTPSEPDDGVEEDPDVTNEEIENTEESNDSEGNGNTDQNNNDPQDEEQDPSDESVEDSSDPVEEQPSNDEENGGNEEPVEEEQTEEPIADEPADSSPEESTEDTSPQEEQPTEDPITDETESPTVEEPTEEPSPTVEESSPEPEPAPSPEPTPSNTPSET